MPCRVRAHIAAHEVGTEIADGGVVDRYRERLLVSEPFPHLQRRELGAWLHSDPRPQRGRGEALLGRDKN